MFFFAAPHTAGAVEQSGQGLLFSIIAAKSSMSYSKE